MDVCLCMLLCVHISKSVFVCVEIVGAYISGYRATQTTVSLGSLWRNKVGNWFCDTSRHCEGWIAVISHVLMLEEKKKTENVDNIIIPSIPCSIRTLIQALEWHDFPSCFQVSITRFNRTNIEAIHIYVYEEIKHFLLLVTGRKNILIITMIWWSRYRVRWWYEICVGLVPLA